MTSTNPWASSFAGASADQTAVYDGVMVPRLFAPWTQYLLDQLFLAPGETVVDVATGPGTVARVAAVRIGATGSVIGCDFSPQMIASAVAKPAPDGAAPIRYLTCPADALAVPDGVADVVTCQHGLQFFPDRPAALAEMRRVSRSGARLGLAVWADIDQSPAFAALANAIADVMGNETAARYRAGPYCLPDPGEVAALVAAAGYRDVTVQAPEITIEFTDASQLTSTLRVSGLAPDIAALDDATRTALIDAVARRARPLLHAGVIRSPTVATVVLAKA